MSSILVAAPLIVFALVVLFGFAGCGLNTRGEGTGDGPTGETGPDGGPLTYFEAVMNSGPIAYWRLSDPEGSPSAKDEVGAPAQQSGDHPGVYQGTVTHGGSPPGLNDSEPDATFALFNEDGEDGVILIGNDMAFETPEFTVEALVRPDSIAGPNDGIVRNISVSGGWALNLLPPPDGADAAIGGQLQAFVRAASASSIEAPFDLAQLGEVWHVAMTLDSTDGLTLYLDGVGVNDPTPSFAPTQVPLQIGPNFHGAIQEVAVYDRALDGEEIGIHHMANTSPPPPPGP